MLSCATKIAERRSVCAQLFNKNIKYQHAIDGGIFFFISSGQYTLSVNKIK